MVHISWTPPYTATTGVLPSAVWNATVRDNLNETAPAKATTPGSHFVADGVNSIAERIIDDSIVETSETSASTTYTNLATNGPVLTATTGTQAISWLNCSMSNGTAGSGTYASLEISGATTLSAIDQRGLYLQNGATYDVRCGVCTLNAVTPGANTFRMQYRVGSGSGTWLRRRLIVMPL